MYSYLSYLEKKIVPYFHKMEVQSTIQANGGRRFYHDFFFLLEGTRIVERFYIPNQLLGRFFLSKGQR
jgi:hypothetical protein